MESMRVTKDTCATTINHLKGSWNMCLQAEGWASGDPRIRNALKNAVANNTFLKKGYDIITPGSPPANGSITINSGAEWTKSTAVTLNLTAIDDSPPIQMCISNTTSCTAWTAFAATKTWTLPLGNGAKTVYAWFRDTWGNATPAAIPYTDTIGLDATAPIDGTLTAIPGAGKIELNWSGFIDALSGTVGYKVVYATGIAPASCATGAAVPGYDGTSTSYTHTGLINLTYGYRICAIDKAGNISRGVTKSAKPL
jgi:hypothetical protein